MSLKTINIFIDSQVIIKNNYLHGSTFKQLLDYSRKGLIHVFITEIIKKEVESNIKKEIEKFSKNLLDSFENAKVLKNYYSKYNQLQLSKFIDIKEVNSRIVGEFKKLYESEVIKVVPINNNVVNEVFEMYFNLTPPFTDKKKCEFPDAFNILTIQTWCFDNAKKAYFVTNDSDFKFYKSDLVFIEPELPKIIEAIVKEEQSLIYSSCIEKSRKIFTSNLVSIKEQIKYLFEIELIKNVTSLNSNGYQFDKAEFLDLKFVNLYYVHVTESEVISSCTIEVDYNINFYKDEKGNDIAMKSEIRKTRMGVELTYDLLNSKFDDGYKIVKADRLNDYKTLDIFYYS